MQKYIVAITLFAITSIADAGHTYKESVYRDFWCRGRQEVTLPNRTRVDCLTSHYAVEVEFAPKWQEAIGQALNYASQSGKKPAILMIVEKQNDWRYYRKCRRVAQENGIRLWYITPEDLP